jgi:hypothetical protein
MMISFEEVGRELAQQEDRIVRQEALIERLMQVGSPVEKAIDRLLQMQLLALDMRGQVARLKKDRSRVAA